MLGFDSGITIVGLGLIGGSFAMALRKITTSSLWAVDIDSAALKAAEQRGIIDKGYTDPEIPLKNSGLIIMCTYPGATIDFVKANMNHFRKNALITDTAGIKEKVIDEIVRDLRGDLDFVAGHPIAGREYKGADLATETLFEGATYIITPAKSNREISLRAVEDMAYRLGIKNVVRVSPSEHDEVIALISQLPHVIAAALIECDTGCGNGLITAAGGSYRDATRVARINAPLWTELFMENSENLLARIENFETNITRIKRAIKDKKPETLNIILDGARIKAEKYL